MTGAEIVRHRDMYQMLFATMIEYLNMGLGPEPWLKNRSKECRPNSATYHLRVRRSAEHADRLRAN